MRRGSTAAGERGQAAVLLAGGMLAVVVAVIVLGGVARGIGGKAAQQRAADLAALAGGRAMQAAYPRLFEPVVLDGVPNPRHLGVAAYRELGRAAASETARRNGADRAAVTFPDDDAFAPARIAVAATARVELPGDRAVRVTAHAEAELTPDLAAGFGPRGPGEYTGPLVLRQGKPMRPDVAAALDRMHAAASGAGVALIVASAFRSNAEQAALFARHPDPKWVAPPGRSLHRLGTELDLGPPSAYGWLATNARRFGFVQRYAWEPWHYGYTRNAGTRSVGYGPVEGRSGLPDFVPERSAPAIRRASQRWNVGAALLAAQLYVESGDDPDDAAAAIDAQAHLMRDLLRRFGSVELALAAYDAGPDAVGRCGCIPGAETRAYVVRVLGLLGRAGDAAGTRLDVRLVR